MSIFSIYQINCYSQNTIIKQNIILLKRYVISFTEFNCTHEIKIGT